MSTRCAACDAAKLDDWVICLTCQQKTVDLLLKIPALHRALSEDARLKLPEKTEQERPSGQTSYGAPANLHAVMLVDKRTDVRATLMPWLEEMYESIDSSATPPHAVDAMCSRMIELSSWWTANLEACPDMISEIKHQYRLLDRAVNGGRRPPSKVPCPVVLPDSGQCEGSLFLHQDGSVSCPSCRSEWAFEDWQRLGALFAP